MTATANQFGQWHTGNRADGFNANGSTSNNSTKENADSRYLLGWPQPRSWQNLLGPQQDFADPEVVEVVGVADSVSATFNITATVPESVAIADAPTATFVTGATVAESVAATDAPTATTIFVANIAESISVTDAPTSVATLVATVAESQIIADPQDATVTGGGVIVNADQSESLSITDLIAADVSGRNVYPPIRRDSWDRDDWGRFIPGAGYRR